jgi:hypothetical protein
LAETLEPVRLELPEELVGMYLCNLQSVQSLLQGTSILQEEEGPVEAFLVAQAGKEEVVAT